MPGEILENHITSFLFDGPLKNTRSKFRGYLTNSITTRQLQTRIAERLVSSSVTAILRGVIESGVNPLIKSLMERK